MNNNNSTNNVRGYTSDFSNRLVSRDNLNKALGDQRTFNTINKTLTNGFTFRRDKGAYTLSLFGGRIKKRFVSSQLRDDAYRVISEGRFSRLVDMVEALRLVPSGYPIPNAPKRVENDKVSKGNFVPVMTVDESYD